MRTVSPQRPRSGFTIIEILVVMIILTTAIGFMASTLISIDRISPVNFETTRALEGARGVLEDMRRSDYDLLFDLYNADPADDPDGPGTAPGSSFAVERLEAQDADPDGLAGEVVLPVIDGQLREDFVDADLGMPRDLNGDGAIDSADHRLDYLILPVRIRLAWQGKSGRRSFELHSALARP